MPFLLRSWAAVPSFRHFRPDQHAPLPTCLQRASFTTVEDAVTAVEDVVERLPDEFHMQQNAAKAVEVVEEIVSPHQLAKKRLKRKQQKSRSTLQHCCLLHVLIACVDLQLADSTIASVVGSRQCTRCLQLQPQQQLLR